jgi:excinuclease ABC subunit B
MDFELRSTFKPAGDQPKAIKQLVEGLKQKKQFQTLLGVTGSGKSLHYDELIFIEDKNGMIIKEKIGEFVEKNLNRPKNQGDTSFQNIKTDYSIISFNPNSFIIKKEKIQQISKHKSKDLFEVTLDDLSNITITKDHNCYKFNNLKFELSETKDLKIGDVLPCSNIFYSNDIDFEYINLLDYNPNVKVNIKDLVLKYDSNFKKLRLFLKRSHKSYNWKIKQIIDETKERGISINELYGFLDILKLKLGNVNETIRIITKGEDKLNPLIKVDENLLSFIGLYISEGHATKKYIIISNSNRELQNKNKDLFDFYNLNYNTRNKNDIQFNSVLFSNFFQIFGKTSYFKKIPSLLYNFSNKQLSLILRSIFDGDGWVENNSIHLMSASNELIYDVKNILLKFDITSRISVKKLKYNGAIKKYLKLNISGKQNLVNFEKHISFLIKYKKQKLNKIVKFKSNTNVDLIYNSNDFFRHIREKYQLYQKDVANICGCNRSFISMIENNIRNPSKKIFGKLADWLIIKNKSYSYLKNLSNYNLRKIISIKKVKNNYNYVYDLSVKNNETFMAGNGNIFVHNTFTMANVINKVKRPTLILAHNKTLAAQLYSEFKDFFPNNRVEYFVSYYDYYQPESYIPQRDMFIEKDSAINPKIEQLRMSATASILSRRDVIVVSSISCIYGLGNPEFYKNLGFEISVGKPFTRQALIKKLVDIQYERNDTELTTGKFRVKGNTIDIIPAYYDNIIRIELFGDKIDRLTEHEKVTLDKTDEFKYYYLFPGRHFVVPEDEKLKAIKTIRDELEENLPKYELLERHRLKQRTMYDLEMIEETGFCKGIENYSRHFENRKAGVKPYTLLDYFPDDFLFIIDESHQTIPQSHGMYKGDFSRKKNLVDYGFRLPCAFDNRPLKFHEFEKYLKSVIFVSATPGPYEYRQSKDQVVEQIIRPTGLIDPIVEIQPIKGQIDDLKKELHTVIKNGHRALITTITKKLAEELTDYLSTQGIKTRYLHSEIKTLERTEIIRELRLGKFDVLVGINLLREGLDIPEVGFIGIMDADKEGFLRDARSLIQIIGRAARNVDSKVVLYADNITKSIRAALDETKRRRNIQIEFNAKHSIVPKTIIKPVKEKEVEITDTKHIPKSDIPNAIIEFEAEMNDAAANLDFEQAINLRDKIRQLQQRLK